MNNLLCLNRLLKPCDNMAGDASFYCETCEREYVEVSDGDRRDYLAVQFANCPAEWLIRVVLKGESGSVENTWKSTEEYSFGPLPGGQVLTLTAGVVGSELKTKPKSCSLDSAGNPYVEFDRSDFEPEEEATDGPMVDDR